MTQQTQMTEHISARYRPQKSHLPGQVSFSTSRLHQENVHLLVERWKQIQEAPCVQPYIYMQMRHLKLKKKKKKNHLNLNPALTCTPEEEQKDIFKDNDREDDHK